MDSLTKFGQYMRHHRNKIGMTLKELSQKVFSKPNPEYIGRLERSVTAGITFATAENPETLNES
jgi:hypothetical protein